MDCETMTVELNPQDPPRAGIDWRKVGVEPVEPRRSPRGPRDTEPCHLSVFIALIVTVVIVLAASGAVVWAAVMYASSETVNAVMAYADAFAGALLQWVARGLQ